MEAVLQSQLDRVETALATLIESIASYNPSIIAANDLLAADDELNNGVKQRKDSFQPQPRGHTLMLVQSPSIKQTTLAYFVSAKRQTPSTKT